MEQLYNKRIKEFLDIASPGKVLKQVPMTKSATETVLKARKALEDILDGNDKRKVVVVGPCSIHDAKAAVEYARKLNKLRKKVEDKMVIVMRAYFEKPRTTVGWKGFVYDPHLDDSYSLSDGVMMARELLVEINDMGLPTGTEVLGPIVIQYYADLICWSAIGARTAESQVHRELASGLSMPVGFKNGTDGNVDIAVNAMISAKSEHSFLGMDDDGRVKVVNTKGNRYCHLILRGGEKGPNYSGEDVTAAVKFCKKADVNPRIFIDCSHANSGKDFRNQGKVWEDVWEMIIAGPGGSAEGVAGGACDVAEVVPAGDVAEAVPAGDVVGVMLESNLFEGNQKIASGWGELKYGVSVTDSCIGFDETERLIIDSYGRI